MNLTQEQALSKLPDVFHPLLNEIWDDYLHADDQVLACACYTQIHYRTAGTTSLFLPRNSVGCLAHFVVLTAHRWIQAQLGRSNEGIVYRQRGRGVVNLSTATYGRWEWKFPPSRKLSHEEFERFKRINEFPLASFPEISHRETYSVSHEGKDHHFIEIKLRDPDFTIGNCLTFKKKDGEHIYSLLQNAAENGGHIRLTNSTSSQELDSGVVEQLQMLSKLHAKGALTKEEFEKLKERLLP